MRKLFVLASVGFLVFGFVNTDLCWSIAGAKPVTNPILLNATGSLNMVGQVPILSQKGKHKNNLGKQGVVFTAFERIPCSFVYVKEPAYFLTTAHCFTGEGHEVDPKRRYARITINGKSYNVDPTSIMIHEGYRKGPADNNLALFSIEPDAIEAFSKSHRPFPLIPADTWIVEGMEALFIGYGSMTESGLEFGFPHEKKFFKLSPSLADVQNSNESLNLGSDLQLLTFVTLNEEKGINCVGDSGGAVVTEFIEASESEPKYHLTGMIVGKIGADGSSSVRCEDTSKYAVVADLRYAHGWIDRAIESIKEVRKKVTENRARYASIRKKLYGSENHFNLWRDWSPERLGAFEKKHKNSTQHEQNKLLYAEMQLEAKRLEARKLLGANSQLQKKIMYEWSPLLSPTPWLPKGTGWYEVGLINNKQSELQFANPEGTKPLLAIEIRNIGDTNVSFESVRVLRSHDDVASYGENDKTLMPGGKKLISFESFVHYPVIENLQLKKFKGHKNIKIYAKLASEQQIAAKARKIELERLALERQREYERQVAERKRAYEAQVARQRNLQQGYWAYNKLVNDWNHQLSVRRNEKEWANKNYNKGAWSVKKWNSWVADYNAQGKTNQRNWDRDVRALNSRYGTDYR